MPPLYLTCKACGRDFFSGVEKPPPETRTHHCTFCNDQSTYEVNDFVVGFDSSSVGAH